MEELVKLLSKLPEYLRVHYTGKKKLVFRQLIPKDEQALVLEQTSAKEEQRIYEDRKSSLKFFEVLDGYGLELLGNAIK